MAVTFKPQGHSTVSPYLIVDGAAGTIAFLEKALGAVELRRYPDEAGRIRHAEVRIDDTVIMIADSFPEWPAMPSYVHVYVRDVDSAYRLALEAGAESVQEPIKKDDDDKRGGIKDAGGTTWWISTRMA